VLNQLARRNDGGKRWGEGDYKKDRIWARRGDTKSGGGEGGGAGGGKGGGGMTTFAVGVCEGREGGENEVGEERETKDDNWGEPKTGAGSQGGGEQTLAPQQSPEDIGLERREV